MITRVVQLVMKKSFFFTLEIFPGSKSSLTASLTNNCHQQLKQPYSQLFSIWVSHVQLSHLQLVQNAATTLLIGTGKTESLYQYTLSTFQWLPMKLTILFLNFIFSPKTNFHLSDPEDISELLLLDHFKFDLTHATDFVPCLFWKPTILYFLFFIQITNVKVKK